MRKNRSLLLSSIFCSTVFLTCGCATNKLQTNSQLKEVRRSEKPLLQDKDIQESEKPFLHDIEIINAETGELPIEVTPGEKVKLKAIPHSYDVNGNDIGASIDHFKPNWKVQSGNIIPKTGMEVTYIAPHSFANPNGYGWLVNTELTVAQVNSEGKTIKSKVYIRFKKDGK